MAVRRKYIRTLVEQILDEHQISGPPVPVKQVAERAGAEVRGQEAPDDLSGFLLRDHRNGLCIIGVNSKHPENRQRFTVGHELGHLLLHEGERIHLDRLGYGLRYRRELGEDETDITDDDETEANIFAAELLMPRRFLHEDMAALLPHDLLGDQIDDVLDTLAAKYRVSTQALAFRLANLGYIRL